jgi:hypothetical protein
MTKSLLAIALSGSVAVVACSGDDASSGANGSHPAVDGGGPSGDDAASVAPLPFDAGTWTGDAGNPACTCAVPAAAQAEDVSHPTTVVGTGTAASCTADAVVNAVHKGGVVTFDCGPDPLTIAVPEIDIYNDGGQGDGSVTIDGGGKITLSGSGTHRILYENTCDQTLHWTTSHCQAQDTPHLVVQNIAFTGGSGTADQSHLGGGAIYAAGGTFKAVSTRFFDNVEPTLGQDYAGGAIYTTNETQPVYVVASSFDQNSGCSGGALGSIGTSWTVLNSKFTGNTAVGHGENPARPGTTGGGLGGAIYNDGNSYTLTVCGTDFSSNTANELGSGSIFQVVDNLNGDLKIDQSTFEGNSNTGSVQSKTHPSIYVEARDKVGTNGVTISANTTFQ